MNKSSCTNVYQFLHIKHYSKLYKRLLLFFSIPTTIHLNCPMIMVWSNWLRFHLVTTSLPSSPMMLEETLGWEWKIAGWGETGKLLHKEPGWLTIKEIPLKYLLIFILLLLPGRNGRTIFLLIHTKKNIWSKCKCSHFEVNVNVLTAFSMYINSQSSIQHSHSIFTSTGSPDTLQEAQVLAMSQADCVDIHEGSGRPITDDMIYVGHDNDIYTGSCYVTLLIHYIKSHNINEVFCIHTTSKSWRHDFRVSHRNRHIY